jgi:hypothetical protein
MLLSFLVCSPHFFYYACRFQPLLLDAFFVIETVPRPLRADNSPPFTTTMIISASVISSTVSNVLLGGKAASIFPTYELKFAAGILPYSDHIWCL